jgi:hypothetical protein
LVSIGVVPEEQWTGVEDARLDRDVAVENP